MFQVLVLICSMAVARPDCQANTAVKVIRGPEAANEVMCGYHGQAYFAQLQRNTLRKGEYIKITCTRTSIGWTAG